MGPLVSTQSLCDRSGGGRPVGEVGLGAVAVRRDEPWTGTGRVGSDQTRQSPTATVAGAYLVPQTEQLVRGADAWRSASTTITFLPASAKRHGEVGDRDPCPRPAGCW